ncbi:hypothetical protein QAD02_003304 [Eretmocerus hayati]|uniref:Uncharacterized protein n=1 Tax=Eretmocerus hayati TaxID=131215 RepID=A0ACC2NR76_9HYME|nr:hypothetical protein QAD02_003304 [Eretmocerus hayati]
MRHPTKKRVRSMKKVVTCAVKSIVTSLTGRPRSETIVVTRNVEPHGMLDTYRGEEPLHPETVPDASGTRRPNLQPWDWDYEKNRGSLRLYAGSHIHSPFRSDPDSSDESVSDASDLISVSSIEW